MPRIPKSFKLAGIEIDVVEIAGLVKEKNVIGEAQYSKQRIVIDPDAAPVNLTEQSFLHELTHWILYIMGEDDLRNNEKFVDLFAHLLYQFECTKQFKSEVKNDKTK